MDRGRIGHQGSLRPPWLTDLNERLAQDDKAQHASVIVPPHLSSRGDTIQQYTLRAFNAQKTSSWRRNGRSVLREPTPLQTAQGIPGWGRTDHTTLGSDLPARQSKAPNLNERRKSFDLDSHQLNHFLGRQSTAKRRASRIPNSAKKGGRKRSRKKQNGETILSALRAMTYTGSRDRDTSDSKTA